MTQAELFEEAARVARMVEGTGLKYWECIKFKGSALWCEISLNEFFNHPNHYEFALAIVEGKPVFKGDVLYTKESVGGFGVKITVDSTGWVWDTLTWNPPLLKPATITINGKELPKPEAGRYSIAITKTGGETRYYKFSSEYDESAVFQAITNVLEGKD